MTNHIETLAEVASQYDAIVLDQWGVLHNGSTPYANAIGALENLHRAGVRLAVLSNSGKRAGINATRIAEKGFPKQSFETVMTSGEALWQDIKAGRISETKFFAIERSDGDAKDWGKGLKLDLVNDLADANAILLMGLPDGSTLDSWQDFLNESLSRKLPIYCTNPDRKSPRAGGKIVISPGALAFSFKDMGGEVYFYGKPHRPVFKAVENALGSSNLLMVGDSLEHDIAGAQNAGWDSLLVRGGLYQADFANNDIDVVLANLTAKQNCGQPTYSIGELK